MSSNSDKQDEAIEQLNDTVPACPFILLHKDTNIGDHGMLYAGGQTGNIDGDGLNTHAQMLGLHMLLVENQLDPDMDEFLDRAVAYAQQLKDGRNMVNFDLDLDTGRPPEL